MELQLAQLRVEMAQHEVRMDQLGIKLGRGHSRVDAELSW